MANNFSVDELTEIESVFNERAMAAAKGDDPEGYKKYGKLAIRTGQMIEAANTPKKPRKARAAAAAAAANDPSAPVTETTPPESPERGGRRARNA